MCTLFGQGGASPPGADYWLRANGISDCLYLSVWTAAKTGKEGLPFLVYIFGGGFQNGDASEPRYDGENMARHGLVAVSVNYRTNVFGFFVHPELTKESPHHAGGVEVDVSWKRSQGGSGTFRPRTLSRRNSVMERIHV